MARSVTHVGRRLTRVLMAAAVYTVVEYGIWVTLLLYAYGRGGVALAGLASVVQLLPAAFLAPALGSLGDRLPRGTAICGAYACLALCLAATGALLVTHAPIALVLVAGAAVTTCISVVRPLHYSVLPQLAPSAASLVSANAVTGVLDGIGVFVGPVLAGLVAVWSGPGTFALLAAVGVGGSVLATARLHLPAALREGSGGDAPDGTLREAVRGLEVVSRDLPVLGLLLLVGVSFFITGALEVLGVSFAQTVVDGGDGASGLLVGATGLGALLGAAAAAGLALRSGLAAPAAVGLVTAGVPLVLIAGVSSMLPAVVLLAVCGLGQAFTGVAGRTLLQRVTDDHVLARVFAVQEGVLLLGLAGGAATAPLLVDRFGAAAAYVPLGAGLVAVSGLTWPFLRRLDTRAIYRVDVLGTLRCVSFLAAMPLAGLERLSHRATWLELPAGFDVVVKGEPGDAFYVVAAGRLSVTTDAVRPPHELAADDSFGEIALLRSVPRTATVRTLEACRLLRVERDDFLAAVTGAGDGGRIAYEVAAAHLAADARAAHRT